MWTLCPSDWDCPPLPTHLLPLWPPPHDNMIKSQPLLQLLPVYIYRLDKTISNHAVTNTKSQNLKNPTGRLKHTSSPISPRPSSFETQSNCTLGCRSLTVTLPPYCQSPVPAPNGSLFGPPTSPVLGLISPSNSGGAPLRISLCKSGSACFSG